VISQAVFEQHGDVFRGGGGGDREAQAGGARLGQQAFDAGAHRDAATCGERRVVAGLGLVQLGHQLVEVVRLPIVRSKVVDIVLHPLLAAGDGEQLAVEGDVPVPVEAGIGKGLIEGGTVTVALGVGKGAVHVEEQGV
jgi:hypothetical protein